MKKSSLLVLGAMSALALSSCTFPWNKPTKGMSKYEKAVRDVATFIFCEEGETAKKDEEYYDATELFTSFNEGEAYFTLWYDDPDSSSTADDPYLELFTEWVSILTYESDEFKGPLAGYSVRSEVEYDEIYGMYSAAFDSPDYKVSIEFAGYINMFQEEGDEHLYIVVLGYDCPYHKGWPSKSDLKKEIGVNQDLPKLDGEFESEWFYNDTYSGIVIDVPGLGSDAASAYATKLVNAKWEVEYDEGEDGYIAYDKGENFYLQFFAYDDDPATEVDESELVILVCNFKTVVGYKGFPDAKFLKANLNISTPVPVPVLNDESGAAVEYTSYYRYEAAEDGYPQDIFVSFDANISDAYALQLDDAGWVVEESLFGYEAYDEAKTVCLSFYGDEGYSVLYIYNYEDLYGKLGFPSQAEIKAYLGVDVAVPAPVAEGAEFRYKEAEDESGKYFAVETYDSNCADEYAAQLEELGWTVETIEDAWGDVVYFANNAEGTIEIQFSDYAAYESWGYYETDIYIYVPVVDEAE